MTRGSSAGIVQPHERISGPLRVALVDDDEGVHSAIRQVFKTHAPSWTLESFTEPAHALRALPYKHPHAVLMDISMPGIDGIECTRKLKARAPKLPIIIFTARNEPQRIAAGFGAGADGYIIKPSHPDVIVHALAVASSDAVVLCPRARDLLYTCLVRMTTGSEHLTPREVEVMGCLMRNMTNQQIADELGIAAGTARIHVENILAKTGTHHRAEACGPKYKAKRRAAKGVCN